MNNCQKYLTGLLVCLIAIPACSSIRWMMATGGREFTVRLETEKPNRDELVELTVKILAFRISSVGIVGDVERDKDVPGQFTVKIYGENDWDAVKRFLFETHELELRKAVSALYPSTPTIYPDKESAQKAVSQGQEVFSYAELGERSPERFIIVENTAIITGEDIRTASAISRSGLDTDYSIDFALKNEGAKKFGDWTGKNIGSYLAIILDKKVQSFPYIKSQITDSGSIDGRFTKTSAEEIALSLNSGHIPGKLVVVSETTFGN
ncbi:MAG: SecDF P1 head subdomain-containing protein [Pyrinomonadaceae bacterium]